MTQNSDMQTSVEEDESVAALAYGVESEEDLDRALDWLCELAANGGNAGQVLAARGLLVLAEAGPPSWKLRALADSWHLSFCDDARVVLSTWRHPPSPITNTTDDQ